MDLESVAVDVEKQDEGDWVDLSTIDARFEGDKDKGESNLRVLLRSIRSDDFRRAHRRARRKLDRMVARGITEDPVKTDVAARTAIAEACILGWENLMIGKEPVAYSPAKALEIMLDKRFVHFHNAVAAAATQVGDRDAEYLETHGKNS